MDNYKSLIAPAALAMLLLAAVTYVEGTWTERWVRSDSQQLAQWSERVAKLPMTIGEWEGKDLPQNQQELDAAGITGSISREYRNRTTGQVVSMFLVCGGARKIAVHTPDKCFVAAGYKMSRDPDDYGVTDNSTFYTSAFSKEGVEHNEYLRVFWGWNAGEGWDAPSMPRWEYRGKEALYKMYLMSQQERLVTEAGVSPAIEFMKAAEGVINETLFPAAASQAAAPAETKPAAG